jgi:cell division protein FtsI/penicillin-binding protein 2
VGRLYSVQLVQGSEFAARAERQYLNTNYSLYDRGSIFFQNKDGTLVSAATLKTGFTVALNPTLLANPDTAYQKISAIMPLDKQAFFDRASKKTDPYEEIAKQIDPSIAQKIDGLAIPGVNIYREQWRFYPGDEMAAHALGFVAYQGNDFSGRYGLERSYQDVLNRDEGGQYSNFFAEIFSNVKTDLTTNQQHEGDIVTTIEPSVQSFLERELKNVDDKYHSEFTGGIIMNPKTGEVYALGKDPTFNPNNLKEAKDSSVFTNNLVEDVYEMGSIIKPLTMAAGIDSGAITPNTTYNDTGSIWLNNKKISNYDFKARGVIPMQQILSQSLNVGAAWVEQQMGKAVFSKYFLSYGLGQKTGIDLPNEATGLVKNLKSPREVEYATASFGQGIAMSPMETVRALAVLANKGHLVTPHLVSQIKYKTGITKTIEYPTGAQVLKPETVDEVTHMLVTVVDTALKNGTVKIANLSVAAKTGTAQIAKTGGGGYNDSEYLHSFFGYFPAYDPKFIVFLYTYKPQGVKYASETLTDSFINITKFLVNYYEIPPDR